MSPVSLTWHGPYRFETLLTDRHYSWAKDAGVYLWYAPFESERERTRTYVGKASASPSLLKRQRDHYANYIGGRYFIPKSFRVCAEDWVPNQYPLIRPIMTDKQTWMQLIAECFRYASEIQVFVAPLPGIQKAELAAIERTLIFDMQPKINSRGKSSRLTNRVEIAHGNLPEAVWASDQSVKSSAPPNSC